MKLLKYYIAFTFLFVGFELTGQQISQFSQYLSNPYLINPAATELQNNFDLKVSYRSQKNIVFRTTDAFYVSGYSTLNPVSPQQETQMGFRGNKKIINSTVQPYNAKLHQVLGGIISKDNFGLVERITAHVNYGVHVPLNENYSISAAATLGYVGLNVSDDYFVLEGGDFPFQRFMAGFQSRSLMDLGLGLWLYSDKIQAGYSVQQLFEGNQLTAGQDDSFEIKNQHFVYISYRHYIDKISIIPSILFRVDHRYGNAMDINIKLDYLSKIWLTTSLRNTDIFVFNLGFKASPELILNYSYDQGSLTEYMTNVSANEFSINLKL